MKSENTRPIHKRKTGNPNGTLCGKLGFRIFLSDRVDCPDCKELMNLEKEMK